MQQPPFNPTEYKSFITALKRGIQRQYDRGINRDLSRHQSHETFIRNTVLCIQTAIDDAKKELKRYQAVEGEVVLPLFDNFVDEFVQYALQRNRTSCAMSNFPAEHKPDQEYIIQTLHMISLDWEKFVESLNKRLAA